VLTRVIWSRREGRDGGPRGNRGWTRDVHCCPRGVMKVQIALECESDKLSARVTLLLFVFPHRPFYFDKYIKNHETSCWLSLSSCCVCLSRSHSPQRCPLPPQKKKKKKYRFLRTDHLFVLYFREMSGTITLTKSALASAPQQQQQHQAQQHITLVQSASLSALSLSPPVRFYKPFLLIH